MRADAESAPLLRQRTNNNNAKGPEGLWNTGRPFGGIVDDYKRRLPHWGSDFTDAFTRKTISSTLFMFFATFASTVSLGELAKHLTKDRVGVTEYLAQQATCGITHALLAGQPLAVLRPTGPITVFVQMLNDYANDLSIDFYPWFAWVGIFVGVWLLATAVFDGSRYIRLLTRFLHDLYATFVCTIYIEDGVSRVIGLFTETRTIEGHTVSSDAQVLESLFQLVLFFLVVLVALAFNHTTSTKLFTPQAREFLTDYALFIAVAVAIATSYAPSILDSLNDLHNTTLERIELPSTFGPTCQCYNATDFTCTTAEAECDTAQGPREWFVGHKLLDVAGLHIFYAFLMSIPIFALFFIDQNLSCLLTQTPCRGLAKGAYYHSGMFFIGIFNVIFPLFGMPFVTASLPHSPQFARALSTINADGSVGKVYENRVAPTIMFAAQGLPLLFPHLLEVVPEGVISGTLTFVGLAGILSHNQFVERCVMCFSNSADWPVDRDYSGVKPSTLRWFTFIQFMCWFLFWVFKEVPYIGIAFPIVIVLVVPFRNQVLPKYFSAEDLDKLDSVDKELENVLKAPLDTFASGVN